MPQYIKVPWYYHKGGDPMTVGLLCYHLQCCCFDKENSNNKHFKDLQATVQGLTWHDSTSTSTSDLAEVRYTHTCSFTHKEEGYIKDITLKHPAQKKPPHAQYSRTETMWTVISAVSTSLHLITRSCFLSLTHTYIHSRMYN